MVGRTTLMVPCQSLCLLAISFARTSLCQGSDLHGDITILVPSNAGEASTSTVFLNAVGKGVASVGQVPTSWVAVEFKAITASSLTLSYTVEFKNSNIQRANVKTRLESGCSGTDCSDYTDAIRDELQLFIEGANFRSIFVTRHELTDANSAPTPQSSPSSLPSSSPTRRRRSAVAPSTPVPAPPPTETASNEESSGSGALVAIIVVVGIVACCILAVGAGCCMLKAKADADQKDKVTPLPNPAAANPGDDVPIAIAVSPAQPAPAKGKVQGKIMIENEEGGEDKRKSQEVKAGAAVAAPAVGKVTTRTFEETRYHELYSNTPVATSDIEGFGLINDFIEAIRERYNLAPKSASDPVTKYKNKVSGDLRSKGLVTMPDIGAFLWTTADTLSDGSKNRELCSYINEAIREDEEPFVDMVVPLVRIINCLIVTTRGGAGPQKWPDDNKTYRGIGMPVVHRKFFTDGKIYRVPMFLATSFKRKTAEDFMRRMSGGELKHTIFIFNFHPVLRCAHANYVGHVSAVGGEGEVLMPPYSGFKVLRTQWTDEVSTVELNVYHDNKHEELKNAQLAPWH